MLHIQMRKNKARRSFGQKIYKRLPAGINLAETYRIISKNTLVALCVYINFGWL